jgi:hypothetical protein
VLASWPGGFEAKLAEVQAKPGDDLVEAEGKRTSGTVRLAGLAEDCRDGGLHGHHALNRFWEGDIITGAGFTVDQSRRPGLCALSKTFRG